MKRVFIPLFVLLSIIFFAGCGNHDAQTPVKELSVDSFLQEDNTLSLAEFIYKSGDYITSKKFPPYVHADDVFYNKHKYLLIDIRTKDQYINGHIDGAYNVPRDSILVFLKTKVNPLSYKKIIIIDDKGPMAIYVATLLHFYGYDNAYGLKFGMGSWNKAFNGVITQYLSNKYASQLDTANPPKPKPGVLPLLPKKPFTKLLDEQVEKNLFLPDSQIFVSPDAVFSHPEKYFIVAYWSEAKFKKGHIPGSIRYNTRSDLSFSKDLKTLPVNKKIVVYCNTGHHAIATVAYLRLVGYDAVSIMYGANSFMNQYFAKYFSGAGITDANVLSSDFPVLKGEKRTEHKAAKVVVSNNTGAPTPPVPVHRKKKAAAGGCE